MKKNRKSQSFLEYSLLLAVCIGGLLVVQAYIARGMKGQMQSAGDQLSDQYAYGLTDLEEKIESKTRIVEWKLPGPFDCTRIKGWQSSASYKEVSPLEKDE